jgi:isochorismate synthase EntC
VEKELFIAHYHLQAQAAAAAAELLEVEPMQQEKMVVTEVLVEALEALVQQMDRAQLPHLEQAVME